MSLGCYHPKGARVGSLSITPFIPPLLLNPVSSLGMDLSLSWKEHI